MPGAMVIEATVSQIIRRPVSEVFNAFVSPEVLTKFWLAQSTGPLEEGKPVTWTFMVPGAVAETTARKIVKNKLLQWDWPDSQRVEMNFIDHKEYTELRVRNWGFEGDKQKQIENAIESTQGFTIVICDLKTWLETGQSHNLVADKAVLIQQKQNL